PLHCRNATPLLVTFDLFAENFRLVWPQRVHRIGDIDEISRQVDQVSPLAGIIFTLRLLRQFDGAGAICEGTAGVMIDKARHAGFASTNPRCYLRRYLLAAALSVKGYKALVFVGERARTRTWDL